MGKFWRGAAIGALALLPAAPPALAQATQGTEIPDPATIDVPDVTPSSDPKIREQGDRFFYFQKPGVSFADAYRDIADCYRYRELGVALHVPAFVPWTEESKRKDFEVPASLAGMLVTSLAQPMLRAQYHSRMRRCMEPRGYVRYAISKAAWEMIGKGNVGISIARQAKLASGPRPNDQVVTK